MVPELPFKTLDNHASRGCLSIASSYTNYIRLQTDLRIFFAIFLKLTTVLVDIDYSLFIRAFKLFYYQLLLSEAPFLIAFST